MKKIFLFFVFIVLLNGCARAVHITNDHDSSTTNASDTTSESDITDMVDQAYTSPPAPNVKWEDHFGSTQEDVIESTAIDVNGNVYIVGHFNDRFNLGAEELVSAGGADILLASYDSSGKIQWAKRFGGVGEDEAREVVIDEMGNLYVTGHFEGEVNFGSELLVSASGIDMFIASYDSSGNMRWAKRYGAVNDQYGHALWINENLSQIAIAGYYNGSFSFGTSTIAATKAMDVFFGVIDMLGNAQWGIGFGSDSDDHGVAVTIDSQGNIYGGAIFRETIDFGAGNITSKGDSDLAVISYDSSGNMRWGRHYGSTGSDHFDEFIVDSSDNIYLSGSFSNTINIGNVTLNSTGNKDVLIASVDSAGNTRWANHYGGSMLDYGRGLGFDSNGNIIFSGNYSDIAYFDTQTISSAGETDIFLASVDTQGRFQYLRTLGGVGEEITRALSVSATNEIVIAGEFVDSTNLGSGIITSQGSFDAFIVKLTP